MTASATRREQGAAENDRFRATTLRFLDGLLKRRVPVDALGMQGHLSAFGKRVDQRKLRAFLEEIRSRGLAVLITELDVDDTGGPHGIAARDRAVADEARRFLDVVLDNPVTQAVLTWSLSDRYVDPPDEWKLAGWRYRKTPSTHRCSASRYGRPWRKPFKGAGLRANSLIRNGILDLRALPFATPLTI